MLAEQVKISRKNIFQMHEAVENMDQNTNCSEQFDAV